MFKDATDAVGRHPDAGNLWRAYAAFEPQLRERALVYARAVEQPLRDVDSLLKELEMLIDSQDLQLVSIVKDAKARVADMKATRYAQIAFESALATRPYFHVTPVAEDMLRTWSSYIDFEIDQGTQVENVDFLFKRCMIVCARYPRFWIKYALWAEGSKSEDAVARIYEEATSVYAKNDPSLWLAYAEYLESRGNVDKARDAYNRLEKSIPNLVETAVKRANFERRQKCTAAAEGYPTQRCCRGKSGRY